MTAIDQNSEAFRLFRDATKDAYGFRMNPTATTQEELEAEYDRVVKDIALAIDEEARQEAAAWVRFEEILEKTASVFNGNRATALRHLVESEECGPYGLDYFCFCYGLSYSKTAALQEILEG